MNSKQIEMILKVSETMNFTKAANALYISQPTLTYQISVAEDEIGFKIFDRSQKSISITPAGKTFIDSLRNISIEYKRALEEAQNYSDKYRDDITISLPYRSAIHLLPKAIKELNKKMPEILITPKFGIYKRLESFLNGDVDILFDDYEVLKNIKGIKIIHLYQSRIYLVCNKSDKLANNTIIHLNDLETQTLMVGGGSQINLKHAQDYVISNLHIPFFNSNDHDTTLTNIEAGKGIVLAPGFLHDRNDGFAWIPFDFKETVDCCIAIKDSDNRDSLKKFIDILIDLYNKVDLTTL